MSRRVAREKALQILFQIDVGRANPEFATEYILEESTLEEQDAAFTRQVVKGTLENISTIDELIESHSQDWDLARLANVDRNILRLGVYELLYRDDIPPSVSINEAVELAKIFGTEESSKFVNGILDAIKHRVAENRPLEGDE
ncbi:transcription antitermination factor NusB [Calderihabitans maritimus]|uniref:Transcription antitermination protein NusB n=1 Tax=Calderihabitans maritimus TaxID=1246530 RepID=A0A1Z5HXM3_9FIRM|nr:transcription antitermination factor NusB [Calderihabitans maritimus]GAW94168.1 NusB antitermination factor [Calderihabitans maritimus]